MHTELFTTFGKLNPRPPTRPDAGRRVKRKSPLQRASRPIVEAIESRLMLSASLIKDINTTYADADPTNFVTSAGELYFNAGDGIHSQPLWQTDGTADGTKLAVSLVPGAPQASMSDFTIANGSIYFFAQGPTDGNQIGLYKSAGSAATTTELGTFTQPGNLTNFNGTLYFSSVNLSGGEEIWISHGTASSTTPFLAVQSVAFLTDADGELFFLDGTMLWKSDGTQSGTMAVASVANGPDTVQIQSVVAVNNRVYLLGLGQLWTSDGTAAGTQQIPDTYEVAAMASYNGALYYTAFGYTDQLWKTDGTSAGTTLVFSQANPNYRGEGGAMTVANNTLYFNFGDTAHGVELWKSDGSSQGTSLIADINPGPPDGVAIPNTPATFYGPAVDGMGVLNGVVYFSGTNGVNGAQLWRSDGTAAGTFQVAQINTTTNGSYPSSSLTIGGTTYFTATDGIHGDELWKTDATSAGTTMVADLNGRGSSYPGNLVNFNGTLYFTASDGAKTNVYKTDGTAAGTSLVFAGGGASLTPVGNYLYFEASDTSGNLDLYRTDGTSAGTKFIQTLMPPLIYPFLGGPIAVPSLAGFDGTLYFTVLGGTSGVGLWKVNPDASTTEIAPLPGALGNQGDLTVVGNTLYFAANDIDGDSAVWRSDGTSAGTYMVRTTGASQYVVNNFYAFDDSLYFTVSNYYPQKVDAVYRTDGTSAGTVLLANSNLGASWNFTFATAGGRLYFSPADGSGDTALYTTDGTAAGTRVVDASITGISSLAPANNLLYFAGYSGGNRELWQTDGTNTSLVDPSEPAAGWQAGSLLGQVNNTFLFDGLDAQHGDELWGVPLTPSAMASLTKSDSTTSGTWTGTYGAEGYDVIGGNELLPSYMTMSTSGASYYQWMPSSLINGDGQAPQVAPGSAYREAATDYAYSSFEVNLDFTDGQTHQVAFYLLDFDNQNRVETVQVANVDSGQVLDTQTVTSFANGRYLVYDLSGKVKVTFINGGPQNAVLSAILFGAGGSTSPASAAFAGFDNTTEGQWTNVYGSQGFDVLGSNYSPLPIYLDFSVTGSPEPQFHQWATSTTDYRDLQTVPGSGNFVAACDYSYATPFGFNLKFLDGQTHQVALYFLDWDYLNRNETIQVSNAVTKQVLDTQTISNFGRGEYLKWDVSGDIRITITNNGGWNAVVSGFFIDAPANASFVKTDSSTMGSYTGIYGEDGYDVINSAQRLPSYASLSFSPSATPYTWAASTTATNALQDSPGSSSRVAACDYSQNSSFSFNLNLTDGLTHQVALYVLDWDSLNRNETIQISDAHTGKLLDSENVSNFTNGKYLVWNLAGDVNVTVVNTGGWNEVLSGIFFN